MNNVEEKSCICIFIMKVLELYSGIGGMHLALKDSGVQGEIVASVDINPSANTVYRHNYPDTKLLNRNIQSLTSAFLNGLDVDTILMSPPCQPFTRNGLKEDTKDPRTLSFVHILNILPELKIKFILIENVKGFETSKMRNMLIQVLVSCGFRFQEFLLSPSQFGVPNTRCRYYCLAKKQKFQFETQALMEDLPSQYIQGYKEPYQIGKILEMDASLDAYYISDEVLLKRATALDICYESSSRSCCFTKAYGRYVTGTGSVFTSKTNDEVDFVYEQLKSIQNDREEYLRCIRKLELRFFTPREVCRLMCFPESFSFPENVTDKQKYMLLGNSINVKVVSQLIKLLVD